MEVARPAGGKGNSRCPFYSRPGYYSYAQLVAMDPANADRDCTMVNGAQQCYNGRPTIRRKTQWAMANAGGMMNWELSQDTGTATSLVSTIFDTASVAQRTGQITGVGGKCVDVAAAQHHERHRRPALGLQRQRRAIVVRQRRRDATGPWQVLGRAGSDRRSTGR